MENIADAMEEVEDLSTENGSEYGETATYESLRPYVQDLDQQLIMVRKKIHTVENVLLDIKETMKYIDETVEDIKKVSRSQEERARQIVEERFRQAEELLRTQVGTNQATAGTFDLTTVSPGKSKQGARGRASDAALDTETVSALECFASIAITYPLANADLKRFLDDAKHSKSRFNDIVKLYATDVIGLRTQLIRLKDMLLAKKAECVRVEDFDSKSLLTRLNSIILKLSCETW